MRVLYVGGFDVFHHGHQLAIKRARALAGLDGQLIMAVNSDAFMAHYKRVPRDNETVRATNVAATGLVDEVTIWDGPEGQDQQILDRHPDVYLAGSDWLGKDLAAQLGLATLAWFDEHQISLMFQSRPPGISTTALLGDAA